MPDYVKREILTSFVFEDIFTNNSRFFTPKVRKNNEFLHQLALGLMPRQFNAEETDDKIIYEEE